MWYEALVPMGIITVAITAPMVVNYCSNVLMFGNPYRRDLGLEWDLTQYVRDTRIAGEVWKTPGLENIPDK